MSRSSDCLGALHAMEVLPPSWPHLSQSNNGQGHDREDSPMPDSQALEPIDEVPPDMSHIVRISSNGSTIDSSGSGDDYEDPRPEPYRAPLPFQTVSSTVTALAAVTEHPSNTTSPSPNDSTAQQRNDPLSGWSNGPRPTPEALLAQIRAAAESTGLDPSAITDSLVQSALRSTASNTSGPGRGGQPPANSDQPEPSRGPSEDSMDSDGPNDDGWGNGQYWTRIRESDSVATGEELDRIVEAGERSALDDQHWKQHAFKDMNDPGNVNDVLK